MTHTSRFRSFQASCNDPTLTHHMQQWATKAEALQHFQPTKRALSKLRDTAQVFIATLGSSTVQHIREFSFILDHCIQNISEQTSKFEHFSLAAFRPFSGTSTFLPLEEESWCAMQALLGMAPRMKNSYAQSKTFATFSALCSSWFFNVSDLAQALNASSVRCYPNQPALSTWAKAMSVGIAANKATLGRTAHPPNAVMPRTTQSDSGSIVGQSYRWVPISIDFPRAISTCFD